MIFYGQTDAGKKREINQDCLGAKELPCGMTLLTVCDGMGGAAGGEIASEMTLDIFLSACERDLTPNMADSQIRAVLSAAVHKANTAVYKLSKEHGELEGMGTTLVAALIINGRDELFLVNVGDSRAYSVSGGSIEQLSFDHSYVQFLVAKGDITPEEAKTHPDRHVITRAVGVDESTKPDIDIIDIERNDPDPYRILLCSDGLTGMLEDEDILEFVNGAPSPEEAVKALISAANDAGGDDNVTVLIAEF